MPSGFWSVTRCDPRTAASALKIASFVTPARLRQIGGGGAAALGGHREQEVLGARELVLELRGLLFGRVEQGPEPRRHGPGCAPPWTFGNASVRAETSRPSDADVRADLAEHRGHDAVALIEQCLKDVLRHDFRIAGALGELLGRQQGFLGLFGVAGWVHGTLSLSTPRTRSPGLTYDVSIFLKLSYSVRSSGDSRVGICRSTVA